MEINIKNINVLFSEFFITFECKASGIAAITGLKFALGSSKGCGYTLNLKKPLTNKSRPASDRATAVASRKRNFWIPTDKGRMTAISSRWEQQYDIVIPHQCHFFITKRRFVAAVLFIYRCCIYLFYILNETHVEWPRERHIFNNVGASRWSVVLHCNKDCRRNKIHIKRGLTF